MKILRFEHTQYSGLGVIDGDDVVAFGNAKEDFPDDLDGLIEQWGEMEDIIRALIKEGGSRVPLSEVKLLAPVDKPGKFLAIGTGGPPAKSGPAPSPPFTLSLIHI